MPVIGWIAWLLGWLMNGIYEVINFIGIPNIALAIIIYTIIVYALMTPIQVRQQKSSKMMAIIQPEMQKIQRKYQGRRDQASQLKMQEEISALQRMYGVSPMGSCLPLLIQLPLLFALYQVIYCIPGYIYKIADIFTTLSTKLVGMGETALTAITNAGIPGGAFTQAVSASGQEAINKTTDFLYALKPDQWEVLKAIPELQSVRPDIVSTYDNFSKVGRIFGIPINLSPWDAITSGAIGLLFVGVLIIFLAWFTNWLNAKLMPQPGGGVNAADTTGTSMRGMNMIMPIFSAFICATLSIGVGVYWITGAVFRCVQQVVLNRRMMNLDAEEMIRLAKEKNEKKAEKRRIKKKEVTNEALKRQAHTNVKKIRTDAVSSNGGKQEEYVPEYYKKAQGARSDSITARANMVRKFEEENSSNK